MTVFQPQKYANLLCKSKFIAIKISIKIRVFTCAWLYKYCYAAFY